MKSPRLFIKKLAQEGLINREEVFTLVSGARTEENLTKAKMILENLNRQGVVSSDDIIDYVFEATRRKSTMCATSDILEAMKTQPKETKTTPQQ